MPPLISLVGREQIRQGYTVLHQVLRSVWQSCLSFTLPSYKMGFLHAVKSSIADKHLMGLILKA